MSWLQFGGPVSLFSSVFGVLIFLEMFSRFLPFWGSFEARHSRFCLACRFYLFFVFFAVFAE